MPEQTYPFTARGLDDALEALGDRPAAFAATLSNLGIRGRMDRSTCCPIANYIRLVVADVAEADVGCGSVWIRNGVPGTAGHSEIHVDYDDDDAIEAFVVEFDAGHFPDLIEEDTHAPA